MSQLREHGQVVLGQPAVKGSGAHPLYGIEQAYGDYLAGMQGRLAVVGYIAHCVIYSTEQLGDKILSGHAALLLMALIHQQLEGVA